MCCFADPSTRGQLKFGDKCEMTKQCGFSESICYQGYCTCSAQYMSTNHVDKCGKCEDSFEIRLNFWWRLGGKWSMLSVAVEVIDPHEFCCRNILQPFSCGEIFSNSSLFRKFPPRIMNARKSLESFLTKIASSTTLMHDTFLPTLMDFLASASAKKLDIWRNAVLICIYIKMFIFMYYQPSIFSSCVCQRKLLLQRAMRRRCAGDWVSWWTVHLSVW